MVLFADGNVYVFESWGHKKYSYGSLYEKSFKEIWNDVKTKSEIMQINNIEKFSNYAHLCKPHKSNKILYQIKSNKQSQII